MPPVLDKNAWVADGKYLLKTVIFLLFGTMMLAEGMARFFPSVRDMTQAVLGTFADIKLDGFLDWVAVGFALIGLRMLGTGISMFFGGGYGTGYADGYAAALKEKTTPQISPERRQASGFSAERAQA